jgi:2-oxoglutarate ferredoxin oxidoreductase subunit alpha
MKSIALFGLTGQGIESAGEILTSVLQSQGYTHRSWRDFSTIIRGGYTAFEVYIAKEGEEVPPPRIETIDIVVVWDDDGSRRYLPRLKDKNLLFGPSSAALVPPENQGDPPNLGFNVWSLGIISGYLGIPFQLIEAEVNSRFRGQSNYELVQQGYNFGKRKSTGNLMTSTSLDNVTLSGNDALCLGAIAGGVRHYFEKLS